MGDPEVRGVVALTQRWRQRRCLEAAVWDMLLGSEGFGQPGYATEAAAEWSGEEIRAELGEILGHYDEMLAQARAAAGVA